MSILISVILVFITVCLTFHEQDWKKIDYSIVPFGESSQWQAYVQNGQNCQWPDDGHYKLLYVNCEHKTLRSVNVLIKK